ncbi:MAG: hypothetical protein A2136_03770 [Chloroflexi bacterium RBG_16_54_11]|nr:MAG: hypothetical protein A2136_03770 [Chloroflexi bacterium RBG_16_54_11]
MKRLLQRHWIIPISLLVGIYTGLPFLAPAFMRLGWESPAKLIYWFYSWQCHQLPQRSFFLFGSRLTYTLTEIQNAWQNTTDPAILRQFIGNPGMGWKVAWSDRMVWMYSGILVTGLLWWPVRHKLKALPWWGLALLILPLAVDGTSHLISDTAWFGQGFRDGNAWLVALTQNRLGISFYSGDAWGSFNSLMRLLTGVLFGIGIVWYTYPYLEQAFAPQDRAVVTKAVSRKTEPVKSIINEYKN